MAKFDYDDIVAVKEQHDDGIGIRRAWIVAVMDVTEKRLGSFFNKFPPGTIYTVEFEDGSSEDFHEDDLDTWPKP